MRIIGVDWGTVRVGVAMSDEGGQLAFPLTDTLPASTAFSELQKLIDEYKITLVVMGLPTSLQGQENESSTKVRKFAEKLKKDLGVAVEFVDERFSSVASTAALHEQGMKEIKQREIKDNIAAALLLQQYLDQQK